MFGLSETRRGWIGLGLLLVVTLVSVTFPSRASIAALNVAALAATLFYPPLGVGAWILTLPFAFHWPTEAVTLRQSVMALVGSSLVIVARRTGDGATGARVMPHGPGALVLGGLALSVGIAALATTVPAEMHIGLITLFGFVMCLLTGWAIRTHPAGFRVLTTAVVLSAMLAVLVALTEYGGAQARLRLGDNVRYVATPVGLALTLLLVSLLSRGHLPDVPFPGRRIWRISLALLLSAALAVTMSRGTTLAVFASILTFAAARPMMGRRADLRVSFARLSAGVILTGVAAVYVWQEYIQSAFRARFGGKWMDFIAAPGQFKRLEVWRSVLGEMTWWEWLVGTGPGSFRQMSLQAGFDHYAHSVFVDALVTTGVGGFVVLSGFLAWVALRLWRSGSALGTAVLTYTIVSFATFGATSQPYFWMSAGLAYGLAWRGRYAGRIAA